MHNRRARPTLRVMAEDLTTGWDSAHPRRLLSQGDYRGLHPLSEQPHPIIAKALACFGHDPAHDLAVGPIKSATSVRLMEVKQSQWRGGCGRTKSRGCGGLSLPAWRKAVTRIMKTSTNALLVNKNPET